MTITRRAQTGAETGHLAELSSYTGAFSVQAVPYTGSYSFKDLASSHGVLAILGTRRVRIGLQIRADSRLVRYLVCFRDVSNNKINGLRWLNNGNVELVVNEVVQDTEVGMNIGTSWMHIGLDCYIHSTSGWVKAYSDGLEVMSYSGNTGNVDITNAAFGHFGDQGTSYQCYFDDIYVDDMTGEAGSVFCPLLKFRFVSPNGAGNYTQWDPSAGSNYQCVDEVPPGDGDYVETQVVDELDSYAMNTYSLGVGEQIQAIIPIARAQRFGTTEEIALGTRLSSVDAIGSDQATTYGSYDYVSERQIEKPGGGDWTQSDLDAVEAVIKSRGLFV